MESAESVTDAIIVDPPLNSYWMQNFLSTQGKTPEQFEEEILPVLCVFQDRYKDHVRRLLVREQTTSLHVIAGINGQNDPDFTDAMTSISFALSDKGWDVNTLELPYFSDEDMANFSDWCVGEDEEGERSDPFVIEEHRTAEINRLEALYGVQEELELSSKQRITPVPAEYGRPSRQIAVRQSAS